jgi:hypothetical protein
MASDLLQFASAFTMMLCGANLRVLRHLSNAKHFPCGTPQRSRNQRKGEHASASNFSWPCDLDGCRHHPAEQRAFAGIPRNVGAANGLHARRLAALRRASPRCGQDRGLLAAKYRATQPTLSRRLRTRRRSPTWWGSRGRAKAFRQRLSTLRQGLRPIRQERRAEALQGIRAAAL